MEKILGASLAIWVGLLWLATPFDQGGGYLAYLGWFDEWGWLNHPKEPKRWLKPPPKEWLRPPQIFFFEIFLINHKTHIDI
jgi:hypothetical protein